MLSVFEATAPVIFRPSILLFMLAGCALRARGFGLDALAAPRFAVPGALAALAVFVLCTVFDESHPAVAEMANIAKRALLVFGVVALAFAIGRRRKLQAFLDRFEPVAFLSYLSHALLAKVIWIAMTAAGVTLTDPSYLLYFAGAPVLVFLLALTAKPVVDALPDPLPLLIKGKSLASPRLPPTLTKSESGAKPQV